MDIAIPIYPGFTALDAVGPYEVLSNLRGATVRDWPLNVFTTRDATDQLPIMRAIVTGDLHNLVFQADYRIIPAVMRPPTEPPPRAS